MTLLYYDSRFLGHETGHHPEGAHRLRAISEHLGKSGLAERCRRPEFQPCDRRQLARVHSPSYMDEIWAFSKSGGGDIEADTVVSPATYDVALLAAGSVVDAVQRVTRGEDHSALCLVRPPGHHALVNRAMGFCIFNNVAVGAKAAIDLCGIERVLIVDFDIHHGNGTQAAFWEDPQVGFLSIHRWPFYPGTGTAADVGYGSGLGTTLNLPIEFGTSRKDYLAAFTASLGQFADRMKPQLLMVSAGFDTHRKDPVGHLGLETEDFITITDALVDVAAVHAGGRMISVLEGGYHPETLAECVGVHLRQMLDRSPRE